MKKWIILCFFGTALIVSCGKKMMPGSDVNNPSRTPGDKTSGPGTQTAATNSNNSSNTTPSFNNSKQTITPPLESPRSVSADKGKTVYVTKCGGCHALKNPGDYTLDQIYTILKTEIPKARLSSREAEEVTAYLVANAKK